MMIYKYWEAMLVSYLATRVTVLPFTNVETLVKNSNYKIVVNPGSLSEDIFRYATNPFWNEAWTSRIEPYLGSYDGNSNDRMNYILNDASAALYTDETNTK